MSETYPTYTVTKSIDELYKEEITLNVRLKGLEKQMELVKKELAECRFHREGLQDILRDQEVAMTDTNPFVLIEGSKDE